MDIFQEKMVKEEVKQCIEQLLQRFWVIKDQDEELYYKITDHEAEIKKFFRETFHFRLIMTYEMIKLEKIPAKTYPWMGEKTVKGNPVFKTQRDFVFFFCFLAFLEGKTKDQQFTLQNICESLQAYYPSDQPIIWKEGIGYQNRLSLVRILKYAVQSKLIWVVDQQIEDFAGDAAHDVLLQRTAFASYFLRQFQTDVTEWKSLNDFELYLDKENIELTERKHRYYRRLFLEPIVYHHEIPEDEADYLKHFYGAVENNVNRYTDYRFERYKHNSLLVRQAYSLGDVCHPSESMDAKLALMAGHYMLNKPGEFPLQFYNEIELTVDKIDYMLDDLREMYRKYWTQKLRKSSLTEIRTRFLTYLLAWNFAAPIDERTYLIKEGLFRVVGDYMEDAQGVET